MNSACCNICFCIGKCFPLDSRFDQRRGQERGLHQHILQWHPGRFHSWPLIFISHRSEAPGWSQQPTVSTKMVNLWLQSLSQSFLDFMTGAKKRSPKGAMKRNILLSNKCFLPQEKNPGGCNLYPWELHTNWQQRK